MFSRLFGKIDRTDVNRMQLLRDIKGLRKALNYQQDKYIRQNAAEALAEIGGQEAFDYLKQAFLSENDDWTLGAVKKALIKVDNNQAMRFFIEALNSNRYDESVRALEKLQKDGTPIDKLAIGPLVDIFRKRDKRATEGQKVTLSIAILKILGNLHDPAVIPTLIEALDDEDKYIRDAAVEKLVHFKDPSANEALISLLLDLTRSKDIRYIVDKLNRNDPGWENSEPAQNGITKLFNQWKEIDRDHRKTDPLEVLSEIHWIPRDEFEQVIKFYLERKWDAIAELGSPALEPISMIMDQGINIEIIKILGKINDPQSIQLLFRIISQAPISRPKAFQMSLFTVEALSILEEFGDSAIDEILNEFYNPKFYIQPNLAIAMGKIGDPRAARPLMEIAKNSDVWSKQAIELLEKIVEAHCSKLDVETLKLIALLDDIYYEDSDTNEFGYSSYSRRNKMDTSKLNQAAQQELSRREIVL